MATNYLPYYQMLGFEEKPPATLATLKLLHRRHMQTIPFENLDIHYGGTITLSPAAHFEKIVEQGRGGFCYEMNGIFYEALKNIGFDVSRISVRVADGKGGFKAEFGHIALVVSIDEETSYLCDVGFGESFIEPLKIKAKLKQRQLGKVYQLLPKGKADYLLQTANYEDQFKDTYRFSLQKWELQDFAEMCIYHQESQNSVFTQKVVCSKALTNGRMTLTNKSLIITENGSRTIKLLETEEAFFEELYLHFNIRL